MRLKHFFFVLIAVASLISCDKVCDTSGLPQHQLTADELSWAAPYMANTEWRFRNAAGYQRVYRIARSETKLEGLGGGKSSICPNLYRQEFESTIERTDSTNIRSNQRFFMQAKINDSSSPFNGGLTWGSVSFQAPIDRLIIGGTSVGPECELLPQLTIGNRTYVRVLKSTAGGGSAPLPRPSDPHIVYMTSEAGLIRIMERGGTVWDRQ